MRNITSQIKTDKLSNKLTISGGQPLHLVASVFIDTEYILLLF